MTRQNALLRLNQNLLLCRKGRGQKLAGELASMRERKAAVAAGDSADMAFDADGDEISSRLAELGDRELSQIERALARWEQGSFGICKSCQKPIALVRLNALPYTPLCIHCEREMEKQLDGQIPQSMGNWGQLADAHATMEDQRISVAQLERGLAEVGGG